MFALVQRTLQEICRLKPQDLLLVGVSGGPDSLALMMLLHQLGWRLVIAHLNHQLRPTANEEEEGVRRWAEQIGAEFVSQRIDVAAYARQCSLSTEDAARYCRYRFLFDQAETRQAKGVLVAHNADDQVETVLMHLLRGAGRKGLSGMKVVSLPNEWSHTIPLVRPLLSVWRFQIMAYLSRQKLEPFLDESNLDNRYTRNRIRNLLIPHLETYNPSIRKLIWQTAQILADEEEVMQAQEELAWQETVIFCNPEMVRFDLKQFRNLQQSVRRRLIRRAYQILCPGVQDLSFSQVEAVVDTFLAPCVSRRRINKLVNCLRDYEQGYLLKRYSLPPVREYPQLRNREIITLPPAGSLRIDGWTIQVERVDNQPYQVMQSQRVEDLEAWLDYEVCKEGLFVRPPKAGDRFAPLSMEGRTTKLSDIFINRKIPVWVRRAYPLICNMSEILWVPGYTISHSARLTSNTRQAVHLKIVQIDFDRNNSALKD